MVSSLLVDTLQNPTRSLLELYDSSKSIDDFPSTVSRHFSDIFKTIDAFQEVSTLKYAVYLRSIELFPQISPLDIRNPPEIHVERSLVRFRAMVQDTSPSPEMYLAKRRGGRCGGWGLTEDTTNSGDRDSINYADLRECTVVWAVNIPGETAWCSREIDGSISSMFIYRSPQSW